MVPVPLDWTFNNINVVWLVSNGGEPSNQTHILVSFVYKAAFNLYRHGYAAALSMVIFLLLLTFVVYLLKRTRATAGAYYDEVTNTLTEAEYLPYNYFQYAEFPVEEVWYYYNNEGELIKTEIYE